MMVVKPSRSLPNTGVPPPRDQYRIGMNDDLGVDSLWDPDDEKFRVLCRMVHVTKAALHIGYVQMMISLTFVVFFAYHYLMTVNGSDSPNHWINQYTARYLSQLLFAVTLQLVLVAVMIHGVRHERRAFLLPYIVFAAAAIIAGCAQIGSDFLSFERRGDFHTNEASSSQFVSHVIALFIHIYCLSVVWRCYGFLGEKKVARQISEQLSATHAAFHYPEQYYGHFMSQPPPYADTVITVPPTQTSPPVRSIIKGDEEKQLLNVD